MPKTTVTTDLRDYALVAERIAMFYAEFPSGQIVTEIISRDEWETVVRAKVYRTPAETRPSATGLAAEREGDGDINAVACLENTETSAVGRALANLGFLASRKRPSLEEMQKAARARAQIAAGSERSGSESGSPKGRPRSWCRPGALLHPRSPASSAGFATGSLDGSRTR